ncbi:GNAT family N-acetyltransferase [Aquibacillus sp. 3ASR75-11]|uniref:GNAT family N-acetyltransferase n=1 Tax=Terrihalobacillus insolitus TaxID=2950438 RepID=A0A9X4AK84_9BACI|nr:GNAT family N-acetyltransferase [Terrihalobacillus insolitus]MDC3412300.1 GNAT family N-acetyltransferase [Terrihalobacillus insolitus]MDC3423007.1 GNAT family N-acetyltransferase [Terrihalobacillus insolitus]
MVEQQLIQIRKLTMNDYDAFKQMKTSVEDDYIVRIFPDLIHSENQILYGLFSGETLLAMAGYTLFPGGLAMLGRLRSNMHFLSNGHATDLLTYIMEKLRQDPSVIWIGANTNEGNAPARRVLEKLGLAPITTLYSLTIKDKKHIQGVDGPIWTKIDSIKQKRELLLSVQNNDLGGVFPFECYYPLPLVDSLISDAYLEDSIFYQSPDQKRFLTIKKDRKDEWYGHVKYFWNDHFETPGFWNTVFSYLTKQSDEIGIWIDFSKQGFHQIPNRAGFDVEDPWMLYGQFK